MARVGPGVRRGDPSLESRSRPGAVPTTQSLETDRSMTRLHDPLRVAQWTVRICVFLAAVSAAMALRAALHPAPPSGTGLSGLLLSLLATLVGGHANAVFWAASSVLLLYFARLVWRHTPKRPDVRWWR